MISDKDGIIAREVAIKASNEIECSIMECFGVTGLSPSEVRQAALENVLVRARLYERWILTGDIHEKK